MIPYSLYASPVHGSIFTQASTQVCKRLNSTISANWRVSYFQSTRVTITEGDFAGERAANQQTKFFSSSNDRRFFGQKPKKIIRVDHGLSLSFSLYLKLLLDNEILKMINKKTTSYMSVAPWKCFKCFECALKVLKILYAYITTDTLTD